MSALALEYIYRYPFPSRLETSAKGGRLRLATCTGPEEHPYFFKGRLGRPKQSADLLRGVVQIVQSRFYVPPAMLSRILALADPVVTSSEQVLRFEAFSACCSTYARADFLSSGLEGELCGRGTTNVDFNAPLRAALARVRDSDRLDLNVGSAGLEFQTADEPIVERKVPLPVRWLKGFVEVQAHQARMERCLEIPGAEAHRFFRTLPRTTMTGDCWIVRSGRELRLSQRQVQGAIPVNGVQRLRVLEELSVIAKTLRIYSERQSRASAWELVLDGASFHLVLSPEVRRGFSGEGQALEDLVGEQWQDVLPRIRAFLKWDSSINVDALANALELPKETIKSALTALGARGLVGYDLALGAYYHRELPFDLTLVEKLQPRLKDARKLLAEDKVQITCQEGEKIQASVTGEHAEHRVTCIDGAWKCTCPWYAKHQNSRGPCKHVLATQLQLQGEGES